MKFQILASGSKGNMTYIETNQTKILLDAGISSKEVALRSEVDLNHIDAIFVTHEHTDHIGYLITLLKKTKATLYIHQDCFMKLKEKYTEKLNHIDVKFVDANKQYQLKDLKILALQLSHDSANCLGYIFLSQQRSLGYISDTGFIAVPYIELLKKVDSLIIESNHDVEMLMNSDRPWVLKERILSVTGHMSNQICGEILSKIMNGGKLSRIVLAHLSEECNTEEICIDTILSYLNTDQVPEIWIAKQREATPIFEV